MKRLCVIFSVYLFTAVACAQSSNELVGTWQLVSAKHTSPNGIVTNFNAPEWDVIKVINATHFAALALRNNAFSHAHGGRYTLQGDTYTEHVEYSRYEQTIGMKAEFQIRLEGDTWHCPGTGSGGTKFEEAWRRVGAQTEGS